MPPDHTTARLFRSWRVSAGLTQRQVAEAFGCTVRAVNFWETGRRAVPPLVCRVVRASARAPELFAALSDAGAPRFAGRWDC